MLSEHFTLTKAHIGWLLLIGCVVGFIGVFSIDLVAIARQSGFASLFTAATIEQLRSPLGIGPAQRLALLTCVAVALLGLTLIPLGSKPA
ncbi:MAG: hypothetical protein AAFV33_11970 [Chloroflexota bacterium]